MANFKDVFISYGRKESLAFSTKLFNRLENKGFKVWFDHINIPKGDDFQERIDNGIESAHNFVFIIAPHAINSEFCLKEIKLALKLNKRIIPILHIEKELEKIHLEIGKINWIYAREKDDNNIPMEEWENIDDFNSAFEELCYLLEYKNTFVEFHTKILSKGLIWQKRQKSNVLLLVGNELKNAENWLLTQFTPPEQPPCLPTELHCEFICESKKNAENLLTEVFISYATENKDLRSKITKSLARNNITSWTHNRDIKSGENYENAIEKGILEASNFLFLITTETIKSDYCLKELRIAIRHNKRIIPLLLDDIHENEHPKEIRKLQYIDFTDNTNSQDYIKDINTLLNVLNSDKRYHLQHKVFLCQAIKWKEQEFNPSILLRGYNLQNAQIWFSQGQKRRDFKPTLLHEKFIEESKTHGSNINSDVFISYSRSNGDFARKLNEQLQINGKITWFDQECIAEGADFQKEIFRGIENSDNFLFIISPESVNSPYCEDEIHHAVKQGKRILTILYHPTYIELIPEALSSIQWIDFTKDFSIAFSTLLRTLNIDQDHVHFHSIVQQQALEWSRKKESKDLLYRGNEFAIAENWMTESIKNHLFPKITDIQKKFLTSCSNEIKANRKKEKEYLINLENALLKAELNEKKAKEALVLSQRKTKEAQSLVLASIARDKIKEDNTVALRIAEAAYSHTEPENIPLSVINTLVKVMNTTANSNPLYSVNLTHDDIVKSFILSPNEEHLITISTKGNCYLWDKRGKSIATFNMVKSEIREALFSPDGKKFLIIHQNNTAILYSIDCSELIDFGAKTEKIQTAVFSLDNHLIVTLNYSNKAKLWNLNGELLLELEGHENIINQISFSPDSHNLLSASEDNTVINYNLKTKKTFHLKDFSNPVLRAEYSPNNKYIIVNPIGNIAYLYNSKNFKLIKIIEGHESNIWEIKFSPDSNYFLTRSLDNTVKTWNTKGDLMGNLNMHQSKINAAHFSPDSKLIVTGSKDLTIKLWQLDGTLISNYEGHTKEIKEVIFSMDCKYLISYALDNTIKIWDCNLERSKGKLIFDIRNHTDSITSIKITNNNLLITSSNDCTCKFWDLQNQGIQHWHENIFARGTIEFSPNKRLLLTGSTSKSAVLWNLKGKILQSFKNFNWHIYLAKFSPNGNLILLGSRSKDAHVFNLKGERISYLNNSEDNIDNASFSFDDKFILTIGKNSIPSIWNLKGDKIFTFNNSEDVIANTTFCLNEKKLIILLNSGNIQIWDFEKNIKTLDYKEHIPNIIYSKLFPSKDLVLLLKENNQILISDLNANIKHEKSFDFKGIKSINISNDNNKVLLHTLEDELILWDFKNEKDFHWTIESSRFFELKFSPNSKMILSFIYKQNIGKLWDLEGNLVCNLNFYKNLNSSIFKIKEIKFSPINDHIITIFENKNIIKLWNHKGQLLGDYEIENDQILKAYFTPDGNNILGITKNNSAFLWPTPISTIKWLKNNPIPKISLENYITF